MPPRVSVLGRGKARPKKSKAARDSGDEDGEGDDRKQPPLDGEAMSEAYRIKQVTPLPRTDEQYVPPLLVRPYLFFSRRLDDLCLSAKKEEIPTLTFY